MHGAAAGGMDMHGAAVGGWSCVECRRWLAVAQDPSSYRGRASSSTVTMPARGARRPLHTTWASVVRARDLCGGAQRLSADGGNALLPVASPVVDAEFKGHILREPFGLTWMSARLCVLAGVVYAGKRDAAAMMTSASSSCATSLTAARFAWGCGQVG